MDSELPPQKDILKEKGIPGFIVDETAIKAGSQYMWLWVAIEPENKQVLALSISKERNMFVAERFTAGLAGSLRSIPSQRMATAQGIRSRLAGS